MPDLVESLRADLALVIEKMADLPATLTQMPNPVPTQWSEEWTDEFLAWLQKQLECYTHPAGYADDGDDIAIVVLTLLSRLIDTNRVSVRCQSYADGDEVDSIAEEDRCEIFAKDRTITFTAEPRE